MFHKSKQSTHQINAHDKEYPGAKLREIYLQKAEEIINPNLEEK